MKKLILSSFSIFAFLFFVGGAMHAQDQTEVTIQVKKDGKVIQDTTYQFEDETDAKHAVKMFEMIGSEGAHEMEFNYTMAHEGGEHANTMVFVSKDGEKTEIKEIHGDSLVWISEEDLEGEPVKVMKYKVKKGDDVKKELKEIMEKVEESDSDQVKVIVIKKGEKPEKEKINKKE